MSLYCCMLYDRLMIRITATNHRPSLCQVQSKIHFPGRISNIFLKVRLADTKRFWSFIFSIIRVALTDGRKDPRHENLREKYRIDMHAYKYICIRGTGRWTRSLVDFSFADADVPMKDQVVQVPGHHLILKSCSR